MLVLFVEQLGAPGVGKRGEGHVDGGEVRVETDGAVQGGIDVVPAFRVPVRERHVVVRGGVVRVLLRSRLQFRETGGELDLLGGERSEPERTTQEQGGPEATHTFSFQRPRIIWHPSASRAAVWHRRSSPRIGWARARG